VTDLFSFDLTDALASGECALCHAITVDERRWIDSFWREGRRDSLARREFFAGRGFCSRHAWVLLQLIEEAGDGAAIADVYGSLADRDLLDLSSLVKRSDRRLRLRSARQLRRGERCAACQASSEAADRKSTFLVELLKASDDARHLYARSAGLCLLHLPKVLASAKGDDELQLFLLSDFERRLRDVRERLAVFDRSRDHRYVPEADESTRQSLTDVVQLYVGKRP
jgi:Family of unknown function (DUF6062)